MKTNLSDVSGLREYVTILRRGWWVIALSTVALAAAAYLTSNAQPKVYNASASVFLNFQNVGATIVEIGLSYTDPVRGSETQANLARLPVVQQRAARIAGVDHADGLLAGATVSPSRGADLLTFAVNNRDPELAAKLATAYAQAYTEYRRELDTSAIVRAREGVQAQLASVAADTGRKSKLYTSLQGKLEQLRTAEALQASNAQVVRRAEPGVQIAPNPRRNAILAGFLGLILGIAIVFGRNALNTRIGSMDEVRERIRQPLIARIPHLRVRSRDEVLMLSDPHAPENEAFRMLAINTDVANLDRGARSIMVTSAHRGEGKSTTMANLAVAYARRGRRVILADMDLRAPAVARLFGASGPGVTDVALGAVSLDDALVPIDIGGIEPVNGNGNAAHDDDPKLLKGSLAILPSGPLPPNAYEFLATPSVSLLIDELVERCDILLIDAPPILRVSDPLGLASKVDALIAVVKLSSIRRHTLDELRRVLDMTPIVQLGFVATGKGDDDDDVYRYGYYGYGYGYGQDPLAASKRSRGLRRRKTPAGTAS